MFQPQPTPFAPSSFASYGLASDLGFGFPVSAGGGGAGFYNSPAPAQPQPQPQSQSQLPQSQSQSQSRSHSHSQSQSQSQPQSQPQPQPHLLHQQTPRQQLSSPAAPSAPSHYPSSQAPNVKSSPAPSLAQRQSHQRPHHHHHQLQLLQPQHRLPQHSQYSSHSSIIVPKMEDPAHHDMAAQQAAAEEYQPVHEGLQVGNKILSDAITHEYAKADPVYVEKTIALPQSYTHYRPIQGDGNCGWRAIGFSYFEKLVESGDQAKVEGEVARLTSMNQLLGTVGNYSYYEDWADEMLDLLREVARVVHDSQLALMLIQEKWNDTGVSSSIIYYLRLLAATHLKANAATYDAFVTDGNGVMAYCSQCVEIPDREIEHLGIIALVHALLEPAGFVLEIAYLDRSPGTRVNRYRFPDQANGQDVNSLGPIIYLLYRPDHYDILYKSMSIQVNRVTSFSHNTDIASDQADLGQYSTLNFDALSMIPGFGSNGSMGGLTQLPPPASSAPEPFSPMQQNSWMSSFPEPLPTSTPQAAPPAPPPIMASPQPPTPPASMPGSSTITPSPAMAATSGPGPQNSLVPSLMPAASNYHIRFSPVQLDYEESKNNFPESTFQVTTNTFKNSIWNRAHYCNPDFHPEEWSPDDEHTDGRVGGKRKSKKEST